MQTKNRRKSVLESIKIHKDVTITELAEELEVSTMTIRRDLKRLSDMGIVTLVHGGAVLNEGTTALAAITARAQRMMYEKNRIAAFCASLVKEGNAVYIDTGSTTMEIAENLKERQNISVLTHSLPVQNILAGAKKIQLIAMPGVYDETTKGFFGEMTCRTIRSFRIDITFIGCSAVDIETGVMSPNLHDQSVKIAALERANKKILAIDHTKIGHVMFTQVCPINYIDMIVTDKSANADFVKQAQKSGVEVVQV